MSSFLKKELRVTLTLSGGPVFEGTNSNVLVLTGLRIIANINSAGVATAPEAQLQIFGMKQSDMNALTQLAFNPLGLQQNTLMVEANSGVGWAQVFTGQIIDAGPDYQGIPDAFLAVHAIALYFQTIQPAAASSYTGPTDVSTIVSTLAGQMGFAFENNGVTAQLSNPYLPNTLGEQLKSVCQQSGTDLYIDNDTIAICPAGTPRNTSPMLLSPESGLVGFPTFDKFGIQVKALFNPGIRFGGPVTIQSASLTPQVLSNLGLSANGIWYVYALNHSLESERPDGLWFSQLGCRSFSVIQ